MILSHFLFTFCGSFIAFSIFIVFISPKKNILKSLTTQYRANRDDLSHDSKAAKMVILYARYVITKIFYYHPDFCLLTLFI